jgi:hypothetical protein
VMVRVSPGSPSQWKATRSPFPAATWRSRQFSLTLSRPPTNHLAKGSSHSSTVSHGVVQVRRSSAWRAQNASTSRSASSQSSGPWTSADAAKPAGGGKVRSSW